MSEQLKWKEKKISYESEITINDKPVCFDVSKEKEGAYLHLWDLETGIMHFLGGYASREDAKEAAELIVMLSGKN